MFYCNWRKQLIHEKYLLSLVGAAFCIMPAHKPTVVK